MGLGPFAIQQHRCRCMHVPILGLGTDLKNKYLTSVKSSLELVFIAYICHTQNKTFCICICLFVSERNIYTSDETVLTGLLITKNRDGKGKGR